MQEEPGCHEPPGRLRSAKGSNSGGHLWIPTCILKPSLWSDEQSSQAHAQLHCHLEICCRFLEGFLLLFVCMMKSTNLHICIHSLTRSLHMAISQGLTFGSHRSTWGFIIVVSSSKNSRHKHPHPQKTHTLTTAPKFSLGIYMRPSLISCSKRRSVWSRAHSFHRAEPCGDRAERRISH